MSKNSRIPVNITIFDMDDNHIIFDGSIDYSEWLNLRDGYESLVLTQSYDNGIPHFAYLGRPRTYKGYYPGPVDPNKKRNKN